MRFDHETADVEKLALAAAADYLAAQQTSGMLLPGGKLSTTFRFYIRKRLGLQIGNSTQARQLADSAGTFADEYVCHELIATAGGRVSHGVVENPYRLWQRKAFRVLGLQHREWALVREDALAFARFICDQGRVDAVATRDHILSGDITLYTQYVALLREDLQASAAAVEAELRRRGPEAAVCKWLALGLLTQESNSASTCTPTNRLRTLFLAEPVPPDEADCVAFGH